MTELPNAHAPRPEFRARLEQDIVSALQRESRFTPRAWYLEPRRARGVLLLVAGLAIGFTTEFASGQVQQAQRRDSLLQAAAESRQLMAMRVHLAEEALKEAQQRFDVGVIGRAELVAATADVQQMRLRFARLESEIAEIRASSAPPRDELWAPLVSGRDFVSERVKIDAAMAQDRLTAAERRLEELQRAERLGAAGDGAVTDAELDVAEARRELEMAAVKLQIREAFLKENLATDEVERRLLRFELMTEMQLGQRTLQAVQRRLERAQERYKVGIGSQLDVERAEVEMLELQLKLRRLQQELRRVER